MELRLDHLRRCKRGRISKKRRLSSRIVSGTPTDTFRRVHSKSNASHERFAHAFRDYTTLSSNDIPILLSQDLDNSEPVSSSLLLLDGSSISPALNNLRPGITRNTSTDDLSSKSSFDIRTNVGTLAQLAKSPHSKQLEISGRRASTRGLGKLLADKYSETYLSRINSILRYSSSNSWRSSVTSFSSRASSLVSRFSAHDKSYKDEDSYSNPQSSNSAALTTEPVRGSVLSEPLLNIPWDQYEALMQPNSALSTKDEIQPKELEIWNELIDERKVRLDSIPQYLDISPLSRKCCAVSYASCGRCGSGPNHRIANFNRTIEPSKAPLLSQRPFSNQIDFYGNHPLHCIAAFRVHCISASSEENGFGKIRSMIRPGAHVNQCNTFGETFLHILCQNGPKTSKDRDSFLCILGDLTVFHFPFSKCDYHGRTALHILFQNSNSHLYSIPFLRQIFLVMKPNLSLKDNAGFCVQDHLEELGDWKYSWELIALVKQHCWPSHSDLSLTNYDSRLFPNRDIHFRAWLEDNMRPQFITSIDDAGDSPLIAMLKYWYQDSWEDMALRQAAENMIKAGAIIHMRDRSGDTALAVAARRGFRLVVTLLLEHGASVHSRNYRGVGILRQVKQALAVGQEAASQTLWSRIWSCRIALIDAGAIIDPTDRDEWISCSAIPMYPDYDY
jgi:ankyrin repeat protein